MKKRISLFLVLMLIAMTPLSFFGVYGDYREVKLTLKTGDIVYINRQTNENYFMTLAGSAIETNIYNVSGGVGAGTIAFCLEHGSAYPPSNAPMIVKNAYYWIDTPNGKSLMYDANTHQPVENTMVTTLRNGYKVTQTDLYALDSVIQKAHSDTRLTYNQRLYAAQNAVRAYMSTKANVFWAPGKIEYSPGYVDGSGRWTVGSVKAINSSYNDIMQLSEEYYNLMLRAQQTGMVISDGYIRHNVFNHAVSDGESTTYQFQIISSDPWRVDADSYTKLTELEATIKPTSGSNGDVITVTIPNDKIVPADEIGLSLRTQVVRGSGGVAFLEPQDKRLQTMYTVITATVDDKQDIIRFDVGVEVDDYPLPEIPKVVITGIKSDREGGFDNDRQSGRGDAKLNAGFEVYVNGEYRTTFYADSNGQNGSSVPLDIWRLSDLTSEITSHTGSGLPQKVEWRGSATVTVQEIVPDGYFSEVESGTGNGIRTYALTYFAVTQRDFEWHVIDEEDGVWLVDSWDNYQYRVTPDATLNVNTEDRVQAPVRFTNLVKKGHLQINKVTEKDLDPWGETLATKEPMAGAKFTISLSGSGSEGLPYLRAVKLQPGDPRYDPFANTYRIVNDGSGICMDGNGGDDSFFVTSEFGHIRIYDIPWGNYQLNEIAASEMGYVLENSNFVIAYDGQLQIKNITNYVIKDEIVIHKVDSETGKRIPSDKMAFRLRYMGNPNTPKEQRPSDPNYGKYLTYQLGQSGAMGYIFYTDANGKCQFPYPLSYGVYQIEEIVAPDGYYLGEVENGVLPYVIHEFVVDKMGANPFEHPVIVIEAKNTAAKGQIEILKTGETLVGFNEQITEYGILNVPVFESKPRDGVAFDIYAKSDIKLPDGIDTPLFITRNGEIIELETTTENHALWKNALGVEETIMNDGTELSVVTQRYPNDLTAMATANLLTATKRPNMYQLIHQTKAGELGFDSALDFEFHVNFDYEIATEYTPDGYVISDINLIKLSEYTQGTIYDISKFPEHEAVLIESGTNKINDISQYRNDIFANGNEVSMDYSVEYYLTAEFEEIKPIEHVYVLEDSQLGSQLIQLEEICDDETGELIEEIKTIVEPTGFVYQKSFAPKFVYKHDLESCREDNDSGGNFNSESAELSILDGENNDDCVHITYLVAVEVGGELKLIECGSDGRAWTNLPKVEDFPELVNYTLMYDRMIAENRIMYKRNLDVIESLKEQAPLETSETLETLNEDDEIPAYQIYGIYEGALSVIGCTYDGKFYDTREEVFNISLYKVPKTQDEIRFNYEGLNIELSTSSDPTHGSGTWTNENHMSAIVHITKPDEIVHSSFNLDSLTQKTEDGKKVVLEMKKTLPSVMMKLNDGTTVCIVYSGGFAFAAIEVPIGNEYPILTYDGVIKSLTLNEQGVLLDPSNPSVDLLTHDASGDRITAEIIAPIGVPEKTIFTIATRRTDKGIIVFDFPDGRKMDISILQDQNGNARGLVSVTCLTPTYRYLLGEFVETVVTGKNNGDSNNGSNSNNSNNGNNISDMATVGRAVSSQLPLGSYIIRERGVSDALVIIDGDYEVTLTYQNNYIPLIWGSISVENHMAAIQLNLKKAFQEGQGSSSYVPKAGAVFGVYTNQEISVTQNTDNRVDQPNYKTVLSSGSLVGILTTDKDGMATSVFKAPFGEYYIKELKTLAGYELNPYMYPFSYNQETVSEPLKTEFTDKGITVEYRYKDDNVTDIVIRTLKRTPPISYSINGVVIDTTIEGTRTVGQAVATSTLSSMDHRVDITGSLKSGKTGKSEIFIDFGDNDTVKLKPKEKGYNVELTYNAGKSPIIYAPTANITKIVERDLADGVVAAEIEYKLGLSNIRYRASLESKYESDVKKPVMSIIKSVVNTDRVDTKNIVDAANIVDNVSREDNKMEAVKIYREIDINAGSDKLVIENVELSEISSDIPFVTDVENEKKHSVDINLLSTTNYINFLNSANAEKTVNTEKELIDEKVNCAMITVKVEILNGVATISSDASNAKITVDGKEIERGGILADGSFIMNSPIPTITYYNKDIKINDSANSSEFIQAVASGTYASGEIMFNNTPLLVYRDGVSIQPDKKLVLDKMIPYTIVMSDAETKADIVLIHDNSLIINLDGKITSNFETYVVPKLESQQNQDFVVDISGNKIEQTTGAQIKTIDGLTYFVTESRTYSRADGYAPITIIDINTADGILQGIINNLKPGETPVTPGKPEEPKPEIPEKPEEPEEPNLPEEEPDREVEEPEISEESIEVDGHEEPNEQTIDKTVQRQNEIPQTGTENKSAWWMLISLLVLILLSLVKEFDRVIKQRKTRKIA